MVQAAMVVISLVFLNACVSASKHKELENQHTQARAQIEELQKELKASAAEVDELETLTAQLEQQLGKAGDDQESLRASITQMKKALSDATKRKQETEARMAQFRDLLDKLKSFTKTGQLSVKIVDGRMVVALPGDVLFPSGSATLSKEGEKTIENVTSILRDISQRHFQVEGHTDNVPISTARFPSNWELAAQRATNVVKAMVEAGMPSERISAASFAATRPVGDNETEEGKKANRRIEIAIVPDMSALPGYDELTELGKESK